MRYSGQTGLKILLTLVIALLTPVAGSCPVPPDADSAYHTMSRLVKSSPHLGIRTSADKAPSRDPEDITHCENGQAGIYPCNNVDLMSLLPLSSIGGSEANDIWGWTDPQTGKEYALIGKTNGTAFVDVSEPEHAEYLGMLPTHTTNSSWRDLKTFANHVYIVSEASSHGMQVFDLTELRSVTSPRTFTATTHYAEFGAAHNIVINEQTGFAYAVGSRNIDDGCGGGLHMIDISRPAVPEFAGCYSADGYTHDAQCVVYNGPDPDHQGQEICFNYNEDTLTIVDVTDKANMVQLARVPYSGVSYAHQGWLTEDHTFLLLDDEGDELDFGHNTRTYIWDVSNLDAPQVLNSFLSTAAAIDHNQYVKGNFSFQANYRAGLRIIDLSNIAVGVLSQNGFFDVFPGSDSASFNGSWSVYPYFESGTVIVSGIEQGLFVLRPTALEPGFMLAGTDSTLSVCGDGINSSFITIDPIGSFTGDVNLQAAGAPAGVVLSMTPDVVTPPADAIVSASVNGALSGEYPLTVTGTAGELRFDQNFSLELSQALPGSPQLLLPAIDAVEVSSIQTLYWDQTDGAFSYDLEVATDPGFTNLVFSVTGTKERSFVPPAALQPGTVHYWRVTANNACGSATSAAASFTTAASQCQTFTSPDVPVTIPAAATGTVTSSMTVSAQGVIVDVNVVDLRATHSWINDIDIKLEGPLNGHARHPERPSVQIMVQSCNNDDDLDINFDDEAAPGAFPCPPTDGGVYQPANPLAAFDGSSGAGDWNLLVTDNFAADGGVLNNWGLQICTAQASQILDLDLDGIDDQIDNCTEVANQSQLDTDEDGFGNLCDGDFNNDNFVNFADLAMMQVDFFQTGDFATDLDGSGIVNFADLNIFQSLFFVPPGPSGLIN
ncbi:MAG: choice-of-anchor B family protein [Gammaproteobacteria bacterium]|nr:choice-of-anchor B family protein [Gammaproteobacteria bacterium]